MKKRALLAIGSIAAAACLACGCGGGSSGSIIILDGVDRTQVSTISVFGNRADRYSLSVIEDTLQKYMSDNVVATYESARESSYWKALDKRFETDNLDDIFWVERDRLLTMTQNGVLANLNDVVNADMFNDFAYSQLFSADGNIYAVPTSISTYGLYANYDLLEKNGFRDTTDPITLEKFEKACEYFKGAITPIICNNYSSLSSLIIAVGLYDTYCNADTASEIKKFNSDPSLLSEHLNTGIDFVYKMIDNGWIDLEQTALTGQGTRELELFASGQYPFMITGGWLADTYDINFYYDINPLPVLENESVIVAQADLVSVKKGANENEAKELVSLLTRSDTLLLLNDYQSRFSPLKTITNPSSAIMPSASPFIRKQRYVISSDIRLTIPLDSYLSECTDMILFENADAAQVKSRLYDLLTRGSADE